MTFRRHLQSLTVGVAVVLLVASSAAARTFNLPYLGAIGGTRIEAGRYKITWEEHSPGVTVTVAKGKNVVTTSEGRLESRSTKYQRNTVVYKTNADGSQSIIELRVGGTSTAIVFSE